MYSHMMVGSNDIDRSKTFYDATFAAMGGTAIEDAPGVREGGGMKLYLAYLRDPDGNKLCALHNLAA